MFRISFFFMLFLSAMFVSAQSDFREGYILTLEGDTLYGEIDYRGDIFNSTTCLFRKGKDDAAQTFNPLEIKEYRFTGGKFYVSREIELDRAKRIVFLEHLVDGKASIYYFPSAHYFLEMDNGDLVRLVNTKRIKTIEGREYFVEEKEYIGILRYAMQDCPGISKEIDKIRFNQADLIDIATRYHSKVCPGEACVVYSKSRPRL